MQNDNPNILAEVSEYYSAKLAEHGPTPRGVDWNGEQSQLIRFQQLSKIINVQSSFSINDLGCGYGSFCDFLTHRYDSFSYSGIDVSKDMILAAEKRYTDHQCSLINCTRGTNLATRERIKPCKDVPVMIAF
jgi:SAM-dependent methyltransferase